MELPGAAIEDLCHFPQSKMLKHRPSMDLFSFIDSKSYKKCENTVKKIIKQVVDALHYLYQNGMLHGDVKVKLSS